MKIYRWFRYDVRRVDEATWEWTVYFKNEDAPRFGGMAKSEYARCRDREALGPRPKLSSLLQSRNWYCSPRSGCLRATHARRDSGAGSDHACGIEHWSRTPAV